MLVDEYLKAVSELIARIRTSQQNKLMALAVRIADSIENGQILHVFGSGHSHMIAEDVFHRAGGLACVNAMLEPSLMELNVGRATKLERLNGYAEVLLSGYDLREGEVIIVVSNSGINAVPIEVALECKKRGLFVVALTNMDHSTQTVSRHASGKKLYEVADMVLDNCGVYGDATVEYNEGLRTGPTSTLGGVFIIQALMVAVIDELVSREFVPPVLVSANRDGGDEHNHETINRYRQRIRYL